MNRFTLNFTQTNSRVLHKVFNNEDTVKQKAIYLVQLYIPGNSMGDNPDSETL